MDNKKSIVIDKYIDHRVSTLGYKILKKYRKQKLVISSDSIDFYDFDEISEEISRLELTRRLKILNQSREKVEFSITIFGWVEIIRGTFYEFINLYNAILITVVLIAFFSASFSSFLELIKAHKNQNAVDVSFYSASIAFYLTVVIIILSIIGIFSSRRGNMELMMFKASKELKQIRKKQDEIINVITDSKSEDKKSILPALTSIESVIIKIAKNTSFRKKSETSKKSSDFASKK